MALWGAEIATLFTKFEKAEFRLLQVKRTFHEDFFVALTVKNTGSTDLTVENVFVNQKPFHDFAEGASVAVYSDKVTRVLDPNNSSTYVTLRPGEDAWLGVVIPDEAASPGQTIEIKACSTRGMEYTVLITME